MEKICKTCEKTFEVKTLNKTFCSKFCREQYKKTPAYLEYMRKYMNKYNAAKRLKKQEVDGDVGQVENQ